MPVNAEVGTFKVKNLRLKVTLDGVISKDEWSDATRIDVSFDGSGATYNGTIYMKHDGVDLWMCIQVRDDDERPWNSPNKADLIAVSFDANRNMVFDVGDDMAVLVHKDFPVDYTVIKEPPFPPEGDYLNGGFENVRGKTWYNSSGGIYTFELAKEINSGDSAGNDIELLPGEEMLTMFSYNDAGKTVDSQPSVVFILSLEPIPILKTLRIIIHDTEENSITDASVSTITQPLGQLPLNGTTGPDGSVTFNEVKQGNYTFQASKNEYQTKSKNIVTGEPNEISIKLEKEASNSNEESSVDGEQPVTPYNIILLVMIVIVILIWFIRSR
jgi:hypothetical protein